MSESVQTLNVSEEKRLDFLRELWDMREGKNSDFAHVVYGQIGQLPEEAKREFTRGKMSELRQMLFECDSRSGAFELSKAASLSVTRSKKHSR